jgi:hypothetical protein
MKPHHLAFALLAVSTPALADEVAPPPPAPAPAPAAAPAGYVAPPPVAPTPAIYVAPPPPPEKHFGIGYKLGDGIGLLGADLIINPVPHLSVDLYGTYVSIAASNGQSGSGYAAAPELQAHLFEGRRSTPYVGVGLQYVHLTLGSAVGSGTGGFANVGYEWKWTNGLGIQLGAGVQYLQKVTATNGNVMLTTGGAVNPNLEFGIRYMFL